MALLVSCKSWDKGEDLAMLEAFSSTDHSDVCLSYIFTSHDFNGVVGKIFSSHNKINQTAVCYKGMAKRGGICKNYVKDTIRYSEPRFRDGYLSENTGIVSFNGSSLSAYPKITFAHEVGHSLGAEHDGEGNECHKTHYMMASHTKLLPKDHQKIFSNCSKGKGHLIRLGKSLD